MICVGGYLSLYIPEILMFIILSGLAPEYLQDLFSIRNLQYNFRKFGEEAEFTQPAYKLPKEKFQL